MVGSADRLADLVRFHLVYRSSPGESTSKQRPTFYSKDLALASRLVASAALPAGDRVLSAMASCRSRAHLRSPGPARSYSSRAWAIHGRIARALDSWIPARGTMRTSCISRKTIICIHLMRSSVWWMPWRRCRRRCTSRSTIIRTIKGCDSTRCSWPDIPLAGKWGASAGGTSVLQP